MNTNERYRIPYEALEEGSYHYSFEVDKQLFEAFDNDEIHTADCRAEVQMLRTERLLTIEVAISGTVAVECDRCLEDVQLPINYSGTLQVRFSNTETDYDGEVMFIADGDELSLAQYIYESVILSLPYQRVHPEGECDPDMLARFSVCDATDLEEGQEEEDNEE